MEDLHKAVGEKIKNLRKSRELTQKELSEKLGISLRNYQNIEYGEVDIGISTIYKLSDIFNTSIDSFFDKQLVDPNALTYLDFLPVGLQVSDTKGKVIYTNQTAIKYQGFSRDEVCNKMFIWDFIEDENEKKILKSI